MWLVDAENALINAWSCVSFFEHGPGFVKATCIKKKPDTDIVVNFVIV